MRRYRQAELPFHRGTRGGRRPDAGRKARPNARVRHRRRPAFPSRFPCHVTLKVREGLASLRAVRVVREVEETFRRGQERPGFRLLHYSIQGDHLHAIVEAEGADALGRGMKSLAARFARAVNRALRRKGAVLRDHYHLHVLETPREVRNALAYVLLNARKHLAEGLRRAGRRIWATPLDPASSARWFDGWRGGSLPEQTAAAGPPPAVAQARTWLLRTGWRRHGLLDPLEVPGIGSDRTPVAEGFHRSRPTDRRQFQRLEEGHWNLDFDHEAHVRRRCVAAPNSATPGAREAAERRTRCVELGGKPSSVVRASDGAEEDA